MVLGCHESAFIKNSVSSSRGVEKWITRRFKYGMGREGVDNWGGGVDKSEPV